jgi:hypothetical protein
MGVIPYYTHLPSNRELRLLTTGGILSRRSADGMSLLGSGVSTARSFLLHSPGAKGESPLLSFLLCAVVASAEVQSGSETNDFISPEAPGGSSLKNWTLERLTVLHVSRSAAPRSPG